MADNIAIKIAIDTADANKSIKEIKQSLAALKDVKAGDINFDEAQKAVAKYKDSLDDLNDTTKALKGSGIEKLNSSLGLLKEGFVNADPGKLGAGFNVLGTAMKAVPIFLIIEGIKYLIDNFEDLKNSTGLVGDAFTAIGDIIGTVIQALKDLTDWLGISSFAAEEAAEKQINAAKATQDAITKKYDAEIRLAKAAGENVAEIEIKKQQAIIDSAKVQFEIIKALAVANGEVSEEQKKQIIELGTAIGNAQLEINVIRVEEETKVKEKLVKINEDIAAENKKIKDAEAKEDEARRLQGLKDLETLRQQQLQMERYFADEEKKIRDKADKERFDASEKEVNDINANFAARQEITMMHNEESFAGQLANLELQKNAELANTELTESEKLLIQQQYAEKKSQLEQKQFQDTLAGVQQLGAATQAITDLVFSHQLKMAEGNAKKEKEIRKRQFKVNKAFAIADSVINGIGAVAKALNNPYPLNIILAVASGILATANTVKIASTKFDEGGGGGGGGAPAIPSLGGTDAQPSGNFQAQGLQPVGGGATAPSTTVTPAAAGPQKVYVVASDLTGQQDKDAILERRASFNK